MSLGVGNVGKIHEAKLYTWLTCVGGLMILCSDISCDEKERQKTDSSLVN